MTGKPFYKTAWLFLFLIVATAAAMVAIPVWIIQPFAAQTENGVAISYLLRNWSPFLTVVFALLAIALAVYIWKHSKRWFGKILLFVPLLLIFVFAWFARQNHFEWMFNPLAETNYASAAETDFIADDEMVLAVKIGGEAVAYPVRQMAYHHLVADVVGGMPITATY